MTLDPPSWGSRGRRFKSGRPDWFFERLYPELGTKIAQLGTIMPAVPQAHTGIPRRQAEQPWPSNPPRRAAAWPGPAGPVAQAGAAGLQNGPLQPTPGTASRWRSPAP